MNKLVRFTAVLLGASLLAGGKCVPYDAELAARPAQGLTSDCPEAGTAQLVVENFAYRIRCGCKETSGKTCTVSNGTTVKWQFADSTSHNVTAVASAFPGSTNQLAGTHEALFDRAGNFDYGCSIHSYDMSGYQIVVADE
jgi:plastocyanin